MADLLITSLPGLAGAIVRYKDMGDGTVAEVIYNVGAGGGGGSNAAAGITGIAVPASASYTGFNVGGNLVAVSAANPLPITGTISATTTANASAAAPTYTAGSNPLSVDLAGNLRVAGAVSISGTLPAFAATPTFNIGTLNGAALDASVQAVKTTLGTPFQAGASIGNTAFAITGLLPAFATTPTVGLASIGLAGATAPASVDLIGIVDQSGNSRSMGGAIFHNSDNQTLGATSYGIITGGVAQIVNQSGTLDRQRETGFDGVPAAGVSAGAQQVAGPPLVTTVISGAITGNAAPQNVTLNAVTFTNRGVVSVYMPGTILLVDTGTAQESVVLTAVNTGTRVVQGIFVKSHAAAVSVMSFAYNQARDATIPDGSTPAGIASSGTYLFNNNTATVEFERSAAGELDGATGVGTNVAAGYEWNGGGPIANGGVITQNQFDRERNLQGKGNSATVLNGATTAGATSIVLTAAVGLLPGMQIRLDRNLGTEETVYISPVYVPGALTVVLQSALAQAHANAGAVEWDVFISAGPGLNGFGPAGIGIEESVVYDPVTGKFFIERSATQDAVSGQNVVMEADALFNGVTFDRPRSVTAAQATTGIGIEASGMMGAYNTTAPVLTNGQYSAAQVDASGNLKVNIVTGTVAVTGTFYQATQPVDTVVKANSTDRGAVIGFAGAVISTTSGSNTVTLTTAPTSGAVILGQQISAIGVPAASYIYALASGTQNVVGSTYTLSSSPSSMVAANATATATGIAGTSAGPQQIMAANATRRGTSYQVQSATANVWLNGLAAATADYHSLKVPSASYFETALTHTGIGAIAAIADTPATPLYSREW